jgi:hypothetical protein
MKKVTLFILSVIALSCSKKEHFEYGGGRFGGGGAGGNWNVELIINN